MTIFSLHQFLTLYNGFAVTILLLFLLLIARFYQGFSGRRTFFRWYLVPMLLLIWIAIRTAGLPIATSDSTIEVLMGIAGITLFILLCILAYWMLYRQAKQGD